MTTPPSPPGPVWLHGPVPGVPPLLQPVAHALVEASQDVQALLFGMSLDRLWTRPAGAASVGYHVVHAMGSLDRLFTYARGESLGAGQLEALAAEKTLDAAAGTPDQVARAFADTTERALAQLRATAPESLLEPREVGRARLPSNVIGLLGHAADHTYRHVGQAITTAKITGG